MEKFIMLKNKKYYPAEIKGERDVLEFGGESNEMGAVGKFICKWFLIIAASYFTAHFIVAIIINVTGLAK